MRKTTFLAAALAATTLFVPAAAMAQNAPADPGVFMEVSGIDIVDGGGPTYIGYLASTWRKNQEYAKSKGWISDYKVYENVFARENEPEIYLLIWYNDIPDAAESMRRRDAFRAFMQQSDADMAAASGDRAKVRTLGGTILLQELKLR